MKVVILAGGLGTRLLDQDTRAPKPMVEIGGRPILWHIMKIYSSFGFNEFIIALGYKGEAIKHFFINYRTLSSDLTIDLKRGSVESRNGLPDDWKVHLVNTGQNTQTGGRLRRLKDWIGHETFMMTYGDGVANIDIKQLESFHRKKGRLVTVTAVRPEARFGGLKFDQGLAQEFIEKPQLGEGWINGGYFVCEPRVLDFIAGDEVHFERETITKIVAQGELAVYQHDGFWQCMDVPRDLALLNKLWETQQAAWKTW